MLEHSCGQYRAQYKVGPDRIEAELTLEKTKTLGARHVRPLMALSYETGPELHTVPRFLFPGRTSMSLHIIMGRPIYCTVCSCPESDPEGIC
jgi:hypothetical protein